MHGNDPGALEKPAGSRYDLLLYVTTCNGYSSSHKSSRNVPWMSSSSVACPIFDKTFEVLVQVISRSDILSIRFPISEHSDGVRAAITCVAEP